jgi:hypothetical protein
VDSDADDIEFSNNGGLDFDYTPVPDADGYDGNVTDIQLNPSGQMDAVSGSDTPRARFRFRVRVK